MCPNKNMHLKVVSFKKHDFIFVIAIYYSYYYKSNFIYPLVIAGHLEWLHNSDMGQYNNKHSYVGISMILITWSIYPERTFLDYNII